MDDVEVGAEGLQALATQCGTVAGELAVTRAPVVGPVAQATTAAASSGYGTLEATAMKFSARVQATGTRLSESGIEFAAQENSSTRSVAAVGHTIEF